jgi:hypothetical protein
MASQPVSRRAAVAALAGAAALGGSAFSGSASASLVAARQCEPLPPTLPDPGSLSQVAELPDPFSLYEGGRLTSPDDWACRRTQLSEQIQTYEYGHLPTDSSATGSRSGTTLTVNCQGSAGSASFTATVNLPGGTGPFPGLILFNPLAASVTSRGYAEIYIDPNAIAFDGGSKTGVFWQVNGTGVDTGVLMAWAWGVHRTLDAIADAVPEIDATRVGVSGYSRYGKAALVAPRPLLTTNGTEGSDIRTNPQGTAATSRAARMVYQYVGAEDAIGIAYRPGGHQIDINDYNAVMDFADWHLKEPEPSRDFNEVPYPEDPVAIPWTIPGGGA